MTRRGTLRALLALRDRARDGVCLVGADLEVGLELGLDGILSATAAARANTGMVRYLGPQRAQRREWLSGHRQ